MSISVLILCEQTNFRQTIVEMLVDMGHVPLLANNERYALEILEAIHVDVCMIFRIEDRGPLRETAERLREVQPLLPIIRPRDIASDTDDPKLDVPINIPFTVPVLDQTIRMAKAIKIVAYYNSRI